jgi:hypothetical protein
VSCTSVGKSIDTTDKSNIHKIASEKFGQNYLLDFNSTKEFVICRKVNKSKPTTGSQLNFFIYNFATNQIIESKKIPLGNISWVSEYEIKVDIHSGIVQKNESQTRGYLLNVKTNVKTKISERDK